MRPDIEAMASRYAATMISSTGGEVISEQVPRTSFFDIDIRREISPPERPPCALPSVFPFPPREVYVGTFVDSESWLADHAGCIFEPRSGSYSHLYRAGLGYPKGVWAQPA